MLELNAGCYTQAQALARGNKVFSLPFEMVLTNGWWVLTVV